MAGMRATWFDRVVSARGLRIATLLLGAALLAWLVVASDVRSILSDLVRVGPGIVGIIALEFVANASPTLAWSLTRPADRPQGVYGRPWWIGSAGYAVSAATPVVTPAG